MHSVQYTLSIEYDVCKSCLYSNEIDSETDLMQSISIAKGHRAIGI